MHQAALLGAALLLVLTACGTDEAAPEPAPSAPEASEPEPAPEPSEEPAAFPERPVTLVIPYGVGGLTDSTIRPIQQPFQEALGERIVIENLPGAAGMVGANEIYHSADADGYRLLAVVFPTHALGELFGDQPVPFLEFEFLGRLAVDAQSIVVPADSPYQTFDDLVEAAAGGTLTMASIGGQIGNLLMGIVEEAVGANIDRVPYDSGFEVARATIDGVVDFGNVALSTAQGMVEDGELRILAHHGPAPIEGFEGIELLDDRVAGSGFSVDIGIVAPPGTPDDVVEILRNALAEAATSELYAQTAPSGVITSYLDASTWRDFVAGFYAYAEANRELIERGG